MATLLTLANVGRVLDLYSVACPERGPAEVGRELGMSRSKAHLLLSSMSDIGLLRRVEGGRYRIGWRALQLDRIAAATTTFRLPGRGAAAALARHTGEMIHLGALDGTRVVYVDRMEGAKAMKVPVSEVGATLPAHCSGVGKVLLADLDPEEVEEIIGAGRLERFTANTITSRKRLVAELEEVRTTGIAYDREEAVTGLACVAAPIRDRSGHTVAALSISAPVERMSRRGDEFRRLVLGACKGVGRQLRGE